MVAIPLVLARLGPGASGDRPSDFGTIQGGDPKVTMLPDGRRMRLDRELAYTDPSGRVWTVPAGYIYDGATIPRSLWSVVGGPFEGRYRTAALFHDIECEKGHWGICLVPSAEVHRMFYNAMRCSGVSEEQADLMWTAVDRYGPKWEAAKDAPHDLEGFNRANRADSLAIVDVNEVLYRQPVAESPFIIGAMAKSGTRDPEALRRDLLAAPAPTDQPAVVIDWSSPEMQRLREAMRKRREETARTTSPVPAP
jgi:hypothetical protein